MNIIAQIFGFIALVFYIVSLQTDNKKKLLTFLIITNTFYSLQYLMLDAYSGLFICLVGMFRSIIFLKFEKEQKEVPMYVLLVVFGIILYSSFISYNDILSLIPISMGFIYSWATWQKNMKRFRIVCIINASSWLFYNFIVGAYVGVLSSIIEFIFAVISLIRFDLKKQ